MKRSIGVSALLLLGAAAVSAQNITAIQQTMEMGKVRFRQPVTATFELRNTGKSDLVIDKVRTNCGCTVADVSVKQILRGKSFILNATYDAKQLGHFEKQVGIYVNGSKEPFILTMKGVVVNPDEGAATDYTWQVGELMVDKGSVEFDDVNRGDRPAQQIRIHNNAGQTVEPVVMHLPSYLSATVSPKKIAPGRSGTVTIVLDSHGVHSYGLTQTNVYLGAFPGDKVSENNEIPVSVVLLPEHHAISAEQRINAPLLKLSSESSNMGTFGKKSKLKTELLVTNMGKTTLDIQSLQMFTAGLDVSLSSKSIAPGQSAKLKITAHRNQLRRAKAQPRILMITNDPDHPKVVINVNYE